jgi:hypothetical protein
MLKGIIEFSYLLGVDPFWMFLLIGLILLLEIVKCLYPWQPKWKSKTTKDENGNEVTTYYRIEE